MISLLWHQILFLWYCIKGVPNNTNASSVQGDKLGPNNLQSSTGCGSQNYLAKPFFFPNDMFPFISVYCKGFYKSPQLSSWLIAKAETKSAQCRIGRKHL